MQYPLLNDLAKNKFYDAYLFYGDSFLVDFFISEVSKKLDLDNDSSTKIYFEEYDFGFCKNRLLESSLFSPKNIVIIKTDKAIPKKELDELVVAANSNKDSFLIIGCYGDNDFKAFDANFKKLKNVFSVRSFSPNPNEALGILRTLANQNGLQIGSEALMHLLNLHRNDLNLCANDIKKLAILDGEVTTKMVDNHCFAMTAVNFDDFFYALLSGGDYANDLNFIVESGDNLILWTNQLQSSVLQILMINSYIKIYGNPDLIEIIGYKPPPKIANQKIQMATKTKTDILIAILEHLQNLELDLKSSVIDDKEGYFLSSIRKISVFLR